MNGVELDNVRSQSGGSSGGGLKRGFCSRCPRFSHWALAVLTGINLFNYIDRYVPSATKELFKGDLSLSDAETSYPLTAFIVVYMITSPIFGYMADKGISRKLIISGGIVLWSVATAGAAFSVDFWTFMLARSFVGVGEAAYATVAPALLSDIYAPETRSKYMSFFFTAIPVGAAIGFGLGGVFGEHWGWRAAFLICGLPGVALALLVCTISDPGRGRFEEKDKMVKANMKPKEIVVFFLKNRRYICAVMGYTCVTFAAGGIADWLPTYLSRELGSDTDVAGLVVGGVTVVGGIGGTIIGSIVADKLKARTKNAYLALSGLALIPGTGFVVLTLLMTNLWAAAGCMLAAQLCLWSYSGPINATIANSVPASLRTRAFSLSILCTHALGDAISPFIIGLISDNTGNLPLAISIVPLATALGCIVWLIGWRALSAEQSEYTQVVDEVP